MSTLAEIEAAVTKLTLSELERLQRKVQRLRQERASTAQSLQLESRGSGVIRLPQDPVRWQQQVREEWG